MRLGIEDRSRADDTVASLGHELGGLGLDEDLEARLEIRHFGLVGKRLPRGRAKGRDRGSLLRRLRRARPQASAAVEEVIAAEAAKLVPDPLGRVDDEGVKRGDRPSSGEDCALTCGEQDPDRLALTAPAWLG